MYDSCFFGGVIFSTIPSGTEIGCLICGSCTFGCAGRLDRHVYIAPPNAAARAQILSIALRKTPHTLETAPLLAMPPTACAPPSSTFPSPSPFLTATSTSTATPPPALVLPKLPVEQQPFEFTPYGATAPKSSSATSALNKILPPAFTPFGEKRPSATPSLQTPSVMNPSMSGSDRFSSVIGGGGGAATASRRNRDEVQQAEKQEQAEGQILQPPVGAERLNAHLQCLAVLTDGCSGAEVQIARAISLKHSNSYSYLI